MRTRAAAHIRLLVILSVLAIAVVGIPAVASANHPSEGTHATATLMGATGEIGQVVFHQLGDGSPNVLVDVEVRPAGLMPGIHGFHIHANDEGAMNGCQTDPAAGPGPFSATDGHYNPDGNDHGAHAGDLPVLRVNEDGSARQRFVTRAFTIDELTDPQRAVIIHGDADNYANIPPDRYQTDEGDGADSETKATGDAGARHACGEIEAVAPDEPNGEPETGTEYGALFVDTAGDAVGFGAVAENTGDEFPGVSLAALLGLVGDPGFHGFHLHAGNRCQFEAGAYDFGYAQGHYNPDDSDHGEHAGDLPVLYMNPQQDNENQIEGATAIDVTDQFDVDEAKGRTLIVHENADNYANIPNRYEQKDGDGTGPDEQTLAGADNGSRLACAMIEGLVRLWGNERVATAVRISQDSFLNDGTAESAVLARKDKFPDALSGVPLADDKGGPILLTGTNELDQQTADELQRVLPEGSTVYVLGGTHAISDDVAAAVEDLGYTVQRLQGNTRFETGTAIAAELDASHDTIFVTTGTRWPDAVSAGGAAAQEDAVILFSAGDDPHGSTDTYLAEHGDEEVHAIGGPAARAYPDANGVVGADRNATSVKVAEEFFPNGSAYAGLARDGASGGDDDNAFADALTGGAQVGRLGAPVLLVDEDVLPDSVRQYLRDNAGAVQRLYAYGGVVAISEDVAGAAEDSANQPSGVQAQSGESSDGSGSSLLDGLLQQR